MLRFSAATDVDRRIDAIFENNRQRGVPFVWLQHPTARPSELGERLRVRGLEEAEAPPVKAVDVRELDEPTAPPGGIEIREAATTDTDTVLEMVAWRWGVPNEVAPKLTGIAPGFGIGVPGSAIRCRVARKDGAPVSMVVLNLDAGAAGIYGVATKPEARGLGLTRILRLQALHTARDAGYTLGVLHSTPMAVSPYDELGFRAVVSEDTVQRLRATTSPAFVRARGGFGWRRPDTRR